jgi:ABC-type multidrug transport system ATPase subunit
MLLLRQYTSTVKRIYLEKKRNPSVTCCEYFSHIIIFIFLVAGYSLSKLESFAATNYAQVTVQIPPETVQGNTMNDTIFSIRDALRTVDDYLRGPIVIPNLDQYIGIQELIQMLSIQNQNLLTSTSFGERYSNLLYRGSLHFAPAGAQLNSLLAYMNSTYRLFDRLEIYVHNSEDAGIDYILNHLDSPAFALIVLRDVDTAKVNYVIRQNYTVLPNTNSLINRVAVGLDDQYQTYLLSGYLTLQRAVDEWAYGYTAASDSTIETCRATPLNTVLIPYPTPAYEINPFYAEVGFLLGLAIAMASLYPVSRTVKTIVEEKETKMRELMKIMGLRSFAYQMAWFLVTFILFFWVAVSETFISSISFLSKSNKLLLFWFFFVFALSEITFSFLISVFFSNSKLASIVAPVVLFSAILPRFIFFTTNNAEASRPKFAASLLSPTALSFAADIISGYERAGVGVQFENMNDGDYSFSSALTMMFVDFILYGILAWYFDLVLPQEYGTPEHPLFFLSCRYWARLYRDIMQIFVKFDEITYDAATINESYAQMVQELQMTGDSSSSDASNTNIEVLSSDAKASTRVLLSNIRKRYPDGKLALKSLSCAMVQDQITCLLGSNGAGKSTAISILTGLVQPSAGAASIYGYDLFSDLHAIRRITGVCPQQNVLFPSLTVTEHLRFFGSIKGLSEAQLRTAIKKIIDEIGLTDKRHAISRNLSGGMKRKLSLAIALIGDPKFVLLDEPTSGMDPYSRRATWDILNRCKAGRVMILTTHFMDEADTLADRIIILSEGSLRCSGSSLFLKRRFGAGYILTLSVDSSMPIPIHDDQASIAQKLLKEDESSNQEQQQSESIEESKSNAHPSDKSNAIELVQSIIPSASVRSQIAGEIVFQLPIDSVSFFSELFRVLRDRGVDVGIIAYGIAITSLEQVFIRLADEARHRSESAVDEVSNEDDQDRQLHTARYMKIFRSCRGWIFGLRNARETSIVHPAAATALPLDDDAELEDLESQPQLTSSDSVPTHSTMIELAPLSSSSTAAAAANTEAKEASYQEQASVNTTDKNDAVKSSSSSSAAPAQENRYSDIVHEKSSSRIDSFVTMLLDNLIIIQLTQLWLKRFITFRRDLKGIFFQIIFPAIQIILVLAILRVSFNPAGRTIRLHLKTYSEKTTPTVIPLFTFQPNNRNFQLTSEIYSTQSLDNYNIEYNELLPNNSYDLSNYYLNTIDAAPKDRLGSLIFDDNIRFNVTVNWNYVKHNFVYIRSLAFDVLLAFGYNASQGISLTEFNIPAIKTSLPTNFNYTDIENIINNLLNISSFNLDDNILPDGSVVSGTISASTIQFDKSGEGFTLSDLILTLDIQNGNTTNQVQIDETGSIVVTNEEVVALLPDGVQSYVFGLPSPYTIMHNSSSPHAIALYHGQLMESSFRSCSPYAGIPDDPPQYLIKNHPLPLTRRQTLEIRVILALFTSLFILVPLCYIPSIFIVFVVQERANKCKHLQLVSGVSPYLYWIATYLWDLSLFSLLALFIMLGFAIYGSSSAAIFIGSQEAFTATVLLLLLYGASSIAISYLYSLGFENHSTAQISIMAINFFTGFIFVLAYFIMINIEETKSFGESIVHFFRFFPPYLVGEGLINLSANYYYRNIGTGNKGYLNWTVTGRNLVFMLVEAIGYFCCMLLLETAAMRRFFHRLQHLYVKHRRFRETSSSSSAATAKDELGVEEDEIVEDEEVVKERIEVAATISGRYVLTIREVRKSYLPG